jgi:hypothetical protein
VGRLHRGVQLGVRGARHPGEHFLRGRVFYFDVLAGIQPAAVDEQVVGLHFYPLAAGERAGAR